MRDVGDLGEKVGCGYRRILDTGNKQNDADLYGLTERVRLTSAKGVYELNPLTGRRENITLYPQEYK